ncbi:DUF3018 family protein [Pantoea sp. Al-1710]|uniref:DUF3018 family protein n=1 Tax=Candidatus Pantoea communis TaxID=2608354 RepID=A0ABX0RKJ3_9GAMM|nr:MULTISPECIES: antitoxin MazE family protein [Pantoea]NIG12987.1 DUF3018 family protein [Pantoea sp. Cy-640]NIG17312.1 DUF3018 family protein [Pantoea communis]
MQSTSRVQKHRDAMRKAGMRPIQIWVPDTRRADFVETCRRQALNIAKAENDPELDSLLERSLNEIEGWDW